MEKYGYLLCACMGMVLLNCDAPYQPYSGVRGGYVDQEISGNLFSVSFYGNGYTTVEAAQKYAKKRAQEVCLKRGSDEYQVIDLKERLTSYVLNSEIGCYVKKGKQFCEDFGSQVQKPIVTIDFTCRENKFHI